MTGFPNTDTDLRGQLCQERIAREKDYQGLELYDGQKNSEDGQIIPLSLYPSLLSPVA